MCVYVRLFCYPLIESPWESQLLSQFCTLWLSYLSRTTHLLTNMAVPCCSSTLPEDIIIKFFSPSPWWTTNTVCYNFLSYIYVGFMTTMTNMCIPFCTKRKKIHPQRKKRIWTITKGNHANPLRAIKHFLHYTCIMLITNGGVEGGALRNKTIGY